MIVKIANHDAPAALVKYITENSPARTGARCVFLCGTQSADPRDGKALVAEFKEWVESRKDIKHKFRQFIWRGHNSDRLSTEQHTDFVKRCIEAEMGYSLYTAWLHVSGNGQVDGHCLIAVPNIKRQVPDTKNERWRLRKVAQSFESEHSLVRTRDHAKERPYKKEELEKAERLCREDPTRSPVPTKMAVAAVLRATAPDVGSLESLSAALAQKGVTMGFRTDDHGRRKGVWYERDGLRFSGSAIGYGLKDLQRLYENNDPTIATALGHSPAPVDHRNLGCRPTQTRDFGTDRHPCRDKRHSASVPGVAAAGPREIRCGAGEPSAILSRLAMMTAASTCLLLILFCTMADRSGGRGRGTNFNFPSL